MKSVAVLLECNLSLLRFIVYEAENITCGSEHEAFIGMKK